MVRDVVARVGAMRWAKPAGLAVVAVALMVLGGFGTLVVRGQAPGITLGGGGVQQAVVTNGSGSVSLCGQMVFNSDDSTTSQPIPTFPAGVAIATATLSHNCSGSVHVDVSTLIASAGTTVFLVVEATCTGGGCPVTGVPIAAEPATGPSGFIAISLGVQSFIQITSTKNFANLPRGRYTITARLSAQGAGADFVIPSLTVQSYGPATPSLP